MRIFDQISREDDSPARHGETASAFYARVAGHFWSEIRDLIEAWFAAYALDDNRSRSDMRSRLRDRSDSNFHGAFLELYLHELLRRAGHRIECHPDVPGKRQPDFLVHGATGSFYLEATTRGGDDTPEGRRLSALYDGLNKLESPNFFLAIDIDSHGTADLATAPLRRRLRTWLDGLDPDEITRLMDEPPGLDRLPVLHVALDGWSLRFRPIPKRPDRRGPDPKSRVIGIYGLDGEAAWIDDSSKLLDALRRKGTRYGELRHPYVIAVGTRSLSADDFDVKNALYGTERFRIGQKANGTLVTTPERAPDGYWFRGNRWAHPELNGVLIVNQLQPTSVARVLPTLWEHPAPTRPLAVPCCWGRRTPVDNELVAIAPSTPPWELFGLPEYWPAGEPFPGH